MKVVVLFLAFFIYTHLYAAHIIGGDISYTCTGFGEYEFTMNVYRDCNSSGALFDSTPGGVKGTVSLFRGSTLVTTIDLDAPTIEEIDLTNSGHPCPEDINLCIEKGEYKFSVQLPLTNADYTFTYQRCCRNPSISNIWMPTEVGITFTIAISEAAQFLYNDSPVFGTLANPIACVFEPLSIDLSATDADGDELRYFFSAPLAGGGLGGTGQYGGSATDLNGVAPDPDAPPPYTETISFVEPNYTFQAPMGGDPVITIDPLTGIISGTPNIIGLFEIGISVEEYSNGTLLSTNQRQVQIKVVDCNESLCGTTSTSNQNNKDRQLAFYPNPSTGIFSFVQEDFIIESYRVFDVYGKVVIQNQVNLKQIDLSDYSAGIYIVQILSTNKELISGKLIKQ